MPESLQKNTSFIFVIFNIVMYKIKGSNSSTKRERERNFQNKIVLKKTFQNMSWKRFYFSNMLKTIFFKGIIKNKLVNNFI